ncbi:glycosyltransferase, partial [Jannaschia sp.]|nr:glycosyltransferase [Jannaschia sp.]
LISHPDRVTDAEYAGYDHVFVASDIYAKHLRKRGLTHVEVLHQATDATLFGTVQPPETRRAAPVFVGNSRREYRTMVKWCVERGVPLDLYGGGWDGVLPPGYLRARSVSNADLPALYAGHVLLLNDHWDSMRDNGFLSNRLFDGSAVGTPILTDPVAGLEAVFGDTIATASEPDAFAATITACLDDPAPFLTRAARAREIVLGAHTFDHRAATLAAAVDRIAMARG